MNFPTRTLDELLAVCRFLEGFPAPWWIGGGWAIDVWAGAPSRDHEDIEICALRSDQEIIFRYCAGWQFLKAAVTHFEPLTPGERLAAPDYMLQLQQTPSTIADAAMPPTFEFLLNDLDGDEWLFPHDHAVRFPFERIRGRSPLGLDVALPEIVLLIKSWYQSSYPRAKDEHDFERVLPLLDKTQRRWLREQLQQWIPDMPWIDALHEA